MVGIYEEWYGWTITCLGCGDGWSDGYRLGRPFARDWRVKSIQRAKRIWANAPVAREREKRLAALSDQRGDVFS